MLHWMESPAARQPPDAAEEALDWLKQLSDHPTGLIQTCAKRDLNSTIAALNYQLGDMAAAAQHMQRAIEDSLHYPTPERQFRDNLRGAQIFMPVDDTPDRVIGCLEAAERNALECEAMPSQMSFVRSFLGTLYNWQGNIERAFEVLNDNLAQTIADRDTIGQIYAYNALSNIYSYWELYNDANVNSDGAVALVRKNSYPDKPSMISDTYMLKARALMEVCPDSVPWFIALADSVNAELPYTMGPEDVDFVAGEWAYKYGGDFDDAIRRFSRYAQNAPAVKRHGAYFSLARIYFDQGKIADGERMLDSLSRYGNLVEGIPMASREALEFCLSHYAESGEQEKMRLYALALVKSDFYESDKAIKRRFATAILDFRLRHAREELSMANMEAEVNRSHLITGICLGVAVLLLTFIVVSYYYRKLQRRHLEELRRNKELQIRLDDQIEQTNTARQGLEDVKNDIDSSRTIEHLYPIELKEKGEAWFVNRFHLLYPGFERWFREHNVSIGKREQVMCMLFVLGQNSTDVASMLSIARTSVNVARYRLRKKLGLDNNTSLDDYLKAIARGED